MYPDADLLFPSLLAVMVVGGSAIHFLLLRSEGIDLGSVLPFYGAFVLVAFAGAKLFSGWVDGSLALVRFDVGYRYPGAIVAVILSLPILVRLLPSEVTLARWTDLLCPGMGISLATYRVGCFFAGCCGGTVSALPWALAFQRRSETWWSQVDAGLIPAEATVTLPVHPLQLYFLGLSLAVGVSSFWLLPRKRYHGQVLLWFLVVHESGRFLLEFLRFPRSAALQLVSGLAALAAILALVIRVSPPPAESLRT